MAFFAVVPNWCHLSPVTSPSLIQRLQSLLFIVCNLFSRIDFVSLSCFWYGAQILKLRRYLWILNVYRKVLCCFHPSPVIELLWLIAFRKYLCGYALPKPTFWLRRPQGKHSGELRSHNMFSCNASLFLLHSMPRLGIVDRYNGFCGIRCCLVV